MIEKRIGRTGDKLWVAAPGKWSKTSGARMEKMDVRDLI